MAGGRLSRGWKELGRRLRAARPVADFGEWVQDWWPLVADGVGVIGLGLASAAANSSGDVVFPLTGWSFPHVPFAWISAIVAVIGLLGTYRNERQRRILREDFERAGKRAGASERVVDALISLELETLERSLKHHSTERVSLFVHIQDRFFLAGRWSMNPTLRVSSREFYPENEGCLWEAWQNRTAYIDNLPDPRTNLEEWIAHQVNTWHVPEPTVRGIKMRSRTYAAFRIDDPLTGRDESGVVIFESQLTPVEVTQQKLQLSQIETVVEREKARLRVLLDEQRKLIENRSRPVA